MQPTRIIAFAIFAGMISAQGAGAQQLRTASPPAETPPSSYQGRQYVDSRGCVYIRAGIDGLVNWVPRVERNRRQVCGFQPTRLSGAAAAPPKTGSAGPELITLPPEHRPNSTAAASQATAPVAPSTSGVTAPRVAPVAVQQKPRRIAPTPVTKAPVVTSVETAPARVKTRRTQSALVKAAPLAIGGGVTASAPSSGTCAGLSEVSRQYTNSTGVRCGPQAQAPVTFGPQSAVHLPPDTRVLPAHLYQERRAAQGLSPLPGYRAVWQDDRLNPRRAEQDLFPRAVTSDVVPVGFTRVPDSIPRANPQRGYRSQTGDLQMAQVWTNTVPRKLVTVAPQATILAEDRAERLPQQLGFLDAATAQQISTAQQTQSPRYVRAGVFADDAAAAQAAKRLKTTGLPVRMGRLKRGAETFKVVLAGPFHTDAAAQSALSQAVKTGFAKARLSK